MHPLITKFLGALRFGTFIFIWIVGAFIVPVSLILLFFGYPKVFYLIILYYLYRLIIPSKSWPLVRRVLRLNETPYCNSQNIVFDTGAEVPKPLSKTMIAAAPHGILTIGFCCMVVL
jgi:hypothetical protein